MLNILSFNIFADAERGGFGCFEAPLMESGNNEGMYFIEDDFHNYIPWAMETEAPPLDINQATMNVKNWFKSKNSNMELDIEEVALKQYDCVVNNEYKSIHVYILPW